MLAAGHPPAANQYKEVLFMSRKIPTLTGEVDASQLGKTYIHEHILTAPPPSRMRIDPDYLLDDSDKIIQELEIFYNAGGRTIMDCTALDYGRDAKRMQEVACRTKVNLLALTGFNRGDYMDWVIKGNEKLFEERIMRDIEQGMDGTECKPAVIKIGTGYNHILPCEEDIIRAAGRAHKKSGLPVITHTTLGTMALEQLDLLEQAGVDANYVALSHLDQNLDFYILRAVAKRGGYIEFDGPSKVKYAPDSARVDMLKRLCDAGLEDRILISGDMGRQSYLTSYGGGPGFGFLLNKFVPRLLDEGFGQDLVDKFFIHNPARYLSA